MTTRTNFDAILLGGLPWKALPTPQEVLPFGEKTVLETTISAFKEAGAKRITLALGRRNPYLDAVIGRLGETVQVVHAPDAEDGLARILRAALAATPDEQRAFAVCFADMPLLTSDIVRKIASSFSPSGKPAVVPVCQDILGHPVVFQAGMRARLMELEPPQTHRDVVLELGDDVELVAVAQTAVLRSIDEPLDYREMLEIARLPIPDLAAYRASLRESMGAGSPAQTG